MSDIELKMLKTLVPQKARAWFLRSGYILDLINGLSSSFEEVRLWFESVLIENFPNTANLSLEEWFLDYGLKFDNTTSISDKQLELTSKVYQIGASNKDYILQVLANAGLINVDIIEGINDGLNVCGESECGEAFCDSIFGFMIDDYYFYYLVQGTVDTEEQFNLLQDILQEIVKVILVPIFQIDVLSVGAIAECGIAECGIAECGNLTGEIFWVVEFGFWDDGGKWIDTATWTDT